MADAVRVVTVPDECPASLLAWHANPEPHMSVCAGEFIGVYAQPDQRDQWMLNRDDRQPKFLQTFVNSKPKIGTALNNQETRSGDKTILDYRDGVSEGPLTDAAIVVASEDNGDRVVFNGATATAIMHGWEYLNQHADINHVDLNRPLFILKPKGSAWTGAKLLAEQWPDEEDGVPS